VLAYRSKYHGTEDIRSKGSCYHYQIICVQEWSVVLAAVDLCELLFSAMVILKDEILAPLDIFLVVCASCAYIRLW